MSLFQKIKNSKRIIIIGRGPTSRFLKKKKNDLLIGINLEKIFDIKFDANCINKKIINLKNKSDQIRFKVNQEVLIGSVPFNLINLLDYLDKVNSNLKKKIILYGFDFNKASNDDDILKKKRLDFDIQELIDVNTQHYAYEKLKDKFYNLNIFKFGFDFYSDFEIENKPQKKIEIIAELTTNHQGDDDRLINLLDSSIKAGCETLKFQRRDVPNFYDRKKLNSTFITPISKTFADYRNKLELTINQINIIKDYQKKYDLKVIFSALDYKSYSELKKFNFKFFKIPSTISKFKNFIQFMSKEKLPEIYISTGMTNDKYVIDIINKFKKFKKLNLLHAISCYPTKFIDINFNIISYYKNLSLKYKNIIPGYSSHDIGSLGCMMAVTAGAQIIEKHVKIGITDWMHFDDTAIDANKDLPNFIRDVNKAYFSMGNGKKKIYKFEHHKYSSRGK